jgi:hypothetical protein
MEMLAEALTLMISSNKAFRLYQENRAGTLYMNNQGPWVLNTTTHEGDLGDIWEIEFEQQGQGPEARMRVELTCLSNDHVTHVDVEMNTDDEKLEFSCREVPV